MSVLFKRSECRNILLKTAEELLDSVIISKNFP